MCSMSDGCKCYGSEKREEEVPGELRWDCSDRVSREGLPKKMKGLKERRVGATWISEEH